MKKRMRACLLALYRSPWGRILLSAVVTTAALLLFTLVQQISYLTNDDNAIAFTLAGYHTGTPWPYALFTNCLLGYAVSALYTLLPQIAWWAVLQIACIGVSCIAFGAVLLREGTKREAPLAVPLAVQAALLLLLILQPFIELTYTVTAAIAGAAGAALILTAAGEEARGTRVRLDAAGLALTWLAFLYREETGFAVLCFFAAACLYRVLTAIGGFALTLRRAACSALALLLAAAVLCGGAFLFNNAMHARVNGAEYETFFRYRERFTDYPRPTYAEAEALYTSAGWDETVYGIADYWCFMDERIDSAAFRTITEDSARPTLSEAARMCVDSVDADVPSRLTVTALMLLFAIGLFAWQRNRRRWPSFALMTALLVGTFLLCLFLCMRGRFLIRTFRVAAIPAAVCCAVLAMRMYAPRADRRGRLAYVLLAALLLVTAFASALIAARSLRGNSPKQPLAESRAVYAYALSHPENVYIRDTFVINNVDAFTVYPDEKPVNLISWGGCELRSAESKRQFAVNGLDSQYADVFMRENVYLITRADSSEYAVLFDYLAKWRGASGMSLVDTITDGVAVYRVTY